LEPLRELLLAQLRSRRPLHELRVGHTNGKLLAELHRLGEVVATHHGDDATVVTVRLDDASLGRATRLGAEVLSADRARSAL
jgi:hypothetical protein